MALDYKLDGARVQVHKDGTEVRVFTRHLREVTAAIPEVVETVGAMPPVPRRRRAAVRPRQAVP